MKLRVCLGLLVLGIMAGPVGLRPFDPSTGSGLRAQAQAVGAANGTTLYLPVVLRDYVPPDVRIVFVERGAGDSLDEYVELRNFGGAALLASWTVSDLAAPPHVYLFPSFTLGPGATVRVWTTCGANTATDVYQCRGAPIWNNNGDTAFLRNQDGVLVSQYTY
jgi:hypothetical protein